jgi:hypothetical protein
MDLHHKLLNSKPMIEIFFGANIKAISMTSNRFFSFAYSNLLFFYTHTATEKVGTKGIYADLKYFSIPKSFTYDIISSPFLKPHLFSFASTNFNSISHKIL